MIQNRIYEILRILLGIIFILGAVLKLLSTNSFEILLVNISNIDWYWAPIVTRLLISFELFLGILILFKMYLKQTLKISLITLVLFTLYLVYLKYFLLHDDNCGCFGSIIKMKPLESIIKNGMLVFISILLLKKYTFTIQNFKKTQSILIVVFAFVFSLTIPFIIRPVDFSAKSENYTFKPHQVIKNKELKNVEFSNNETINLLQGKKAICFLSLTCKMCKYTASKLAILNRRNSNSLPIYIVFLKAEDDNEKLISQFYKETDAYNIPYTLFEPKDFFRASDKKIPFIMVLDNGEIKDLSNYSDLYPDKLLEELIK